MSPSQEGFSLAADSIGPPPIGGLPTPVAVPSHELLFQLQQQLQHQHLAQQGLATAAAYGYPAGVATPHQSLAAGFPTHHQYMAAAAAPPAMLTRVSSSTPPMMRMNAIDDSPATRSYSDVGDDDTASLMQRLETKEHMVTQLGSFLSQMKQEADGTAATWKEKLQELAELKRQLVATTQQLAAAHASEQETAAELTRVQQELEAAGEAQREREQTHVEELTIMNNEIKKRENEVEHVKLEYEQSLTATAHELLATQERQQEADTRCSALEATLCKLEDSHRTALTQVDDEKNELTSAFGALTKQLDALNREKHELGQHLWNVTRELELGKQRENELERKCAAVVGDLETTQCAWSERFHHFQNEKEEQLGAHSLLQTELHELSAKLQAERSQKEELNAMVGRELEHFRAETAQLQQSHNATLERVVSETEHWRLQSLALQDKLTQSEQALQQAAVESEDVRARLEQVGQECQHWQQHGSEKATTLQELNNELGRVMAELEDVQSRHRQLAARWERRESGLLKCLQLLPASSSSVELEPAQLSDDAFPVRIASALEDYTQLSSSLNEAKIAVLRARQELDSDHERARQREQELLQQSHGLESELATTRADAKTLAHELQQLSRQCGGTESKLATQVQQLAKDLDETRASAGLQALQLQKSVDVQRTRTSQLESEKRELLQEAEQLNAAMEALYQARSERQAELDQLRASWNELRLEHSDLKESYEDLEDRTARTIGELNAKLAELHTQVQTHHSDANALRAEHNQVLDQLGRIQAENEAGSQRLVSEQAKRLEKELELNAELEGKTRRMGEMMEMLTQLQTKTEQLEKARASDDQSVRQELDRYQQQLLGLGLEKKRLESAVTSLKAQYDQSLQDACALKEEKRQWEQQQSECDDELSALKSERARLQSELERTSRAKTSLQAELHRLTDEAQDVVRQFEVTRRDARAFEKSARDDAERLRRELDELRTESSDANALIEELQTKMASIQSAANATIHELMTELQSAQEATMYEKSRLLKENDALKTQLQALDDDVRRRDADTKELRQEKDRAADRESDMSLKLARVSTALEQKRLEVDKLGKELEAKALKAAEYERKFAPLAHAKESLQATTNELKQRLDATTRAAHELEERFRDDLARAAKDKRELEALYVASKDDCDALRSQTSGQQQHWQSECKALKQSVERGKSELSKAAADVRTLTQRLEACQNAANETIAELSTRLAAIEQQKESALNALQRELGLERERRREAEVAKCDLQRLLRQQPLQAQQKATAWSSGAGGDVDAAPPKPSSNGSVSTGAVSTALKVKQVAAPEIRKFYANEPLTNAELSSLPMALITAQIGLDLATSDASPTMAASRVRHVRDDGLSSHQQQQQEENNDDVPPLPLEKLPQCVRCFVLGAGISSLFPFVQLVVCY